jgi:hypothetical protein
MIAMANVSLLQLTPKQQSAIPTLALQAARRVVKRKLQAQGRKLSLICAAEITRLAEDYALEHRDELLPQAIALAQRIYPIPVHQLGIEHRQRRPDPQAELLCKSQVQNATLEAGQ